MLNQVEVPADVRRLVEGLRDTGYSFNTAIADIIDNSIVAKASNIIVRIEQDPTGDVFILVVDNGHGMNEEELLNAIKYGSKKKENPKSLSKFGLGLKTGSTAFCRRLSVISKRKETELERATFDLDNIIEKWMVERDKGGEEFLEMINDISDDGSGTVILWEKVDRLIKRYVNPTGRDARNALKKVEKSLIDHLAMIFQRFLNKDDERAENISIYVNDIEVVHWDPFCEWHSETRKIEETVPVDINDHEVYFTIRSFIIPRKEEIDSSDELALADIKTANQGIYVYRENRMICGPDWLGIYSKEPHQNLMRVEFSFDYDMDDAFHVDIKKSKISLNETLYNWLQEFLTPQRRAADERYRKGIKKIITEASKGVHDDSNRGIGSKESSVKTTESEVENAGENKVKITNKGGTVTISMPVSSVNKDGEVVVKPVDSIDDGLLWQPCQIINDGHSHHGVEINTAHPYYEKVYIPNIQSGVTIQGMDSLLWSLCEAERSILNVEISKQLRTLRYEVSKILRDLVEDLPEPKLEDDG